MRAFTTLTTYILRNPYLAIRMPAEKDIYSFVNMLKKNEGKIYNFTKEIRHVATMDDNPRTSAEMSL